jgi:hypothetical protein
LSFPKKDYNNKLFNIIKFQVKWKKLRL